MVEEAYQKGVPLVEQDTNCDSIIFIVSGKVDIVIVDEITTDAFILDTLKQGDFIG